MASKRKAEEAEEGPSKKTTEKPLVKKLTAFVQDVLKKHGSVTLNDAKKLWNLACDGSGVTQSEFHTLDHILADECIPFTSKAKMYLHHLVTRQESGKSMYKIVDGVKYDRSCLDLAEHLFKDGKIDLGDARQLWEEIEDGPGVTEVEKRTIEKIMVDKAAGMTHGATKFFKEKIAAWVPPKHHHHEAHPTTTTTTTSPKVTPMAAPASPKAAPASPAAKPSPAPKLKKAKSHKAVPLEVKSDATESKDIPAGERIELIVDKSGSMRSLLDATVKGLNDFLTQQKGELGAEKRHVRLTTFNDKVTQPPAFHCALSDVPEVTPKVVMPDGGTSLLDAIGTVLSSVPIERVSVVIIVTDGDENSSKVYKQDQINKLIADRMAMNWTFVFLAANQDAIASGAKYGLPAGSCATFAAAVDGVVAAFQAAHGLASRSWKSVEVEQRSFTTNERNSMQNKA